MLKFAGQLFLFCHVYAHERVNSRFNLLTVMTFLDLVYIFSRDFPLKEQIKSYNSPKSESSLFCQINEALLLSSFNINSTFSTPPSTFNHTANHATNFHMEKVKINLGWGEPVQNWRVIVSRYNELELESFMKGIQGTGIGIFYGRFDYGLNH